MFKELTYKGKELPIRVSYYALKKLKLKLGRTLSADDDSDYEGYEVLLYYALEAGHKKAKMAFNFKLKEMEEMMDEVYFPFMKMIPLFFPKDIKTEAEKAQKEKLKKGDQKIEKK